MSKILWMSSAVGILLMALGLVVAGCEKGKSPTSGDSGTPPGGGTPSTAEAPEESSTSMVIETPKRRSEGVDDQDDPDAPRSLPRTADLRGWVKVEPVRVTAPDELDDFIESEPLREALGTFQLRRGARCAYRHQIATARAMVIEALSPEDAFGVFSILTTAAGKFNPADGTIRAVEKSPDGAVISGWQGNTFARVRCSGEVGSPAAEECEGMLNRILFNVPTADPPWLLRAIQSEKGEPAKLWLVRSTAALVATGRPVFKKIDPAAMDKRLGLAGITTLGVAAIRIAEGESPNVVWLAQYADAAKAQAAGERYRKAIEKAAGGLDANTILDQPKGPYLAGSWTADQESIQRLLPKLKMVLPD